ncbi:hypothetical protein HMPREF9336_04315 [Segniliparus rugosus ATCC BAA-974]|uniref:Uncharacterized protein n=1 Tax=Segniliparus rugosus (strain ATCC BAA-974 / DSM 45345 / CCUG 50838 / CIP 108380 / JCM 13579 / CDC 945) TaxID=679197 RepID=U1LMJ5_SEGRC|nr:hypothetical protein HMPREF9336_04315 [Segniliparus rugosus ATCC BAA-974]
MSAPPQPVFARPGRPCAPRRRERYERYERYERSISATKNASSRDCSVLSLGSQAVS